ncbi:Uncharacterised protein [Bordetella pertussis]|nr:Uncharacterised protein [Bordetella pertussis]CFM96743.1 Uncharacterised protein [Bordetella pertussis]CFN17529.1 Uncharacterised protein [Bordetella pertussis]CFN49227.1 Uncharacterised protein [Bordetella pertussis]CFN77901.1 Uncharacterised protein [Bordetella pertussis]
MQKTTIPTDTASSGIHCGVESKPQSRVSLRYSRTLKLAICQPSTTQNSNASHWHSNSTRRRTGADRRSIQSSTWTCELEACAAARPKNTVATSR